MHPRLTVVEHVYFGDANGVDHGFDSMYTEELRTNEQTWERTKRVGEKWEPLELGWVTTAALLLLRNDGATQRLVNPTDTEKAEDAAAVLEVAVGAGHLIAELKPGQSLRIPYPNLKLCVRCTQGTTRYTVRIVPNG